MDAATGELRKRGILIRLSGQPFQILQALLAKPGELVTREQLRDSLWSEGTFVDFEGSLNAAVTKLRRALNDSADNPRYVETVTGLGYRFIGPLDREREIPPSPPVGSPIQQPLPGKQHAIAWWWIVPAAAACLISFLAGWRLHSPPTSFHGWKVTRLTADPGVSNTPAISADGKLVVGYTPAEAYQSSSIDWWLIDANGNGAAKTGAYDVLQRAGILMRDSDGYMQPGPVNNFPKPSCWLKTANQVIFSVQNGHAGNVWGSGISLRER